MQNNSSNAAAAAINAVNNNVALQSAASAPVVQAQVQKVVRISHLKLAPQLLAKKAFNATCKHNCSTCTTTANCATLQAFTKSFNARGVQDKAFIAKRATIYMHIARVAQQKANAAKKAQVASKKATATAKTNTQATAITTTAN